MSKLKCPHCSVSIQVQTKETRVIFDPKQEGYGSDISYAECSACEQLIVWLRWGVVGTLDYDTYTYDDIVDVQWQELLYPKGVQRTIDPEVPVELADEFREATAVLTLSPKASAAISRRLLQRVLREHYKIMRPSLAQEIDEFLQRNDVPTFLKDAVDAIRAIGNLAAHPLKDTNTGLIVDVEPGEAEWLLEVLETLFDFAYVQPARLASRKKNLNAKLNALGKPPMKS